eukprot:scaffold263465_cov18-Tisochrysis_lutea.AAC.2
MESFKRPWREGSWRQGLPSQMLQPTCTTHLQHYSLQKTPPCRWALKRTERSRCSSGRSPAEGRRT